MAPGRRRSPSESEDDVSREGTARASPRPRLSPEQDGSDNESADDVKVSLDDISSAHPPGFGTQAHFQALVDAGDNRDVELRELAKAERAVATEMQQYVENQERKNGIIQSVQCINFMCHEHLTIDLGPLINFIVGHNGSGKSAVLTAITLCLGGKAVNTNRGQSLKSFVKEGKETATLIVKIKNHLPGAYRYDHYGRSIIVERHFSIHGTSSFKLKSDAGKLISTKRAELDEITDFYALQLDNPVNVLTQDMARQFLNNSTPNDKYKFFIKGVQLEQMNNDYNLVYENLLEIGSRLQTLEEVKSEAQDRYRAAKDRFHSIRQQGPLTAKKQEYYHMHAWAQVNAIEQDQAKLEENVRAAEAFITTKQSAAEEHSRKYDSRDQEHAAAANRYEELNERLPAVHDTVSAARALVTETDNEMRQYQSNQRDIKGRLDGINSRIKKAEDKITAERTRLEAMNGGHHAALLQAVTDTETRREQAQRELDAHPEARPALEQIRAAAELKQKDLLGALERKRAEVDAAESKLREIQQSAGSNPMRAYPTTLQQVLNAIDRETRFREKPIGPIGMFVKLNDAHSKWSPILEPFFGGILNNFVVTSKHDEKILSDLLRRFKHHCGVMIGSARHIDTASQDAPQQYESILRVLSFDNDLVRNQLIINQSIEKVLLIHDRTDAVSVLNLALPNVRQILCFQDTSRSKGYTMSAGRGNKRMDPIGHGQGNRLPRIATDKQAQIDVQQHILRAVKQEYSEVEAELRTATNDLTVKKQHLVAHDRKLKELREREQRARADWEHARTEYENATTTVSSLDGLKDSLAECTEEKRHETTQFRAAAEALQETRDQNATHQTALDDAEAQLNKLKREIAKAEGKANDAARARETALRQKNEAIEAVDEARRQKADRARELEVFLPQVDAFRAAASSVCARIAVDLDTATIERKIKELDAQIGRLEREAGGRSDEIARAFRDAKAALAQTRAHQRNIEAVKAQLHASMAERAQRWRFFRSAITARARIMFGFLLSERAFRGELLFDHMGKSLDLLVEPDARSGNSSNKGGRETQTLSGGEKSFSTICLLLALWDAMGSPVRCLDEFDVFMDSVNRHVSMKMMIVAARRSVGRQYILITPQSMESVARDNDADDVRIHMMRSPERGQTALSFGA